MSERRSFDKPAVGGGKRRVYIYAGAGVLVLGVVYWEYRKGKNAPAATATATDPTAYDPNAYDPNAGYYTSNPGYGSAVGVTPGSTDTTGSTTDTSTTTPTSVDVGTTGVPFNNPTNNVEWVATAITLLSNNGYDTAVASVALGKFITGAGLTQDEYNIVTAALAVAGNPPTSVPPPHLLTAQGSTYASNPVSGLHVTSKSRTSVSVAWSPAKNAHSYQIAIDGDTIHTVGGTSYSFGSLKPGTTHTVHMHAEPAAPNFASASVTFTLPK